MLDNVQNEMSNDLVWRSSNSITCQENYADNIIVVSRAVKDFVDNSGHYSKESQKSFVLDSSALVNSNLSNLFR